MEATWIRSAHHSPSALQCVTRIAYPWFLEALDRLFWLNGVVLAFNLGVYYFDGAAAINAPQFHNELR